jgi:predicted urease superfamily metal-dependent hydrolase
MRWLKSRLRRSGLALLGAADFTASVLSDQTEVIRQLMLNAMGEFGERHYPKSVQRVRYAHGAVALWYARTDLMAVMSAKHGEAVARKTVNEITALFRDLLPRSLASRTGSLS